MVFDQPSTADIDRLNLTTPKPEPAMLTATPRQQLLQVALVAQISICSCRTTPRKQMQTPTRSTSTTMDSSEQNSNVVIWFEPVEIQPESERRPVLSDRHTVAAAETDPDSTRTTLIDANGEVVHVFDTGNVLDIDWGVRNESATTRSTAKPPTKPTASTPPADESDLEGPQPRERRSGSTSSKIYTPAPTHLGQIMKMKNSPRSTKTSMTLRNIALVHQRRLGGIRSRIKRLELER